MTQKWPATQAGVGVTAPAAQLLPLKVCTTPVLSRLMLHRIKKPSNSGYVFEEREICGLVGSSSATRAARPDRIQIL
jgi:hypothetical protein